MPTSTMIGAPLMNSPPNMRFFQPGHGQGIFPGPPQYMHAPMFNGPYRMPNHLPMPPIFRQRLPRFRPRYPRNQ